MRTSYVAAFLVALGIVALTTPLVLAWSRRLQLFDQPDGERKVHTRPIPRTGGLSIAAGVLLPLVALALYNNDFSTELRQDGGRLLAFVGGLLTILALGAYDDLRGVGAWGKLAVQCAVGVVLWHSDLRVESISLFDQPLTLGWSSLPLTMLWVAAFINAMNLIDGLDGLAAGVAFFASVSLFAIALIDGSGFLALVAATTGGAAAGFLLFNFSPALIFMGDSGSMTLGYVFAAAGLWSASKRTSALALVLPLLSMGVPIADTGFAFVRRMLAGRSPFHSDRGHIHHRLIGGGLSHRQAVLTIYGACVLLSCGAIALRATEDMSVGISILALCIVGAVALQLWVRHRSRAQAAPTESSGP